MQGFRHIRAWQRAHALAIELHRRCAGFSAAGHAHLRSQLTRAADSIATNVVEGCGSATHRELARYLDIAIKSAMETEHHLLTVEAFGLLPAAESQRHIGETIEIRKMLYAYRRRVLETASSPP